MPKKHLNFTDPVLKGHATNLWRVSLAISKIGSLTFVSFTVYPGHLLRVHDGIATLPILPLCYQATYSL